MHKLSVGQPYNPARRSWPECAQYNYRNGSHELLLFLASPSEREVKSVRGGESEFAILVAQPVIVLCYRFASGLPWSDAPFSWHLVPEAERELPPEPGPEQRATLQVLLVDAATGIVRAIRLVTLSPDATMILHRAIAEQAAEPWDPGSYDRALEELYRRYPSSEAMARAAVVRVVGGI
jgi:hypothetical protein